jgi:hypothetical protein
MKIPATSIFLSACDSSLFLRVVFFDVSQASTLASAYRSEPYRQLRQAPLAPFVMEALSLDQCLVRQTLSGNASHEAVEPGQCVVLNIAFVQSEGKFINVATKMLWTRMVVDTNDAALENRENALNSVGGHVVSNILASAMVDSIMVEARVADASICASLVGMQYRSGFDVLMNNGLDCFLICALDRHCNSSTAALAHPKNGRLADRTATGLEFFVFVLVSLDSTDIGFIDFDNAAKLLEVTAAGFAKPMQKEPGRLLRDPDFFGKLKARNTLARRNKQIHRVNPLVQWNMGALEYRSGANGEILLALIATIEAALAFCDTLAKSTYRAARTIQPKPSFKVDPRGLLIREHLEQFEG